MVRQADGTGEVFFFFFWIVSLKLIFNLNEEDVLEVCIWYGTMGKKREKDQKSKKVAQTKSNQPWNRTVLDLGRHVGVCVFWISTSTCCTVVATVRCVRTVL